MKPGNTCLARWTEFHLLLPDQWVDANPEHRVKLREDEAKQTALAKYNAEQFAEAAQLCREVKVAERPAS